MPEDARDDDRRDPFEEWREQVENDPFLGPFFEDLDREFERLRESLSRMLEDMQEGKIDPEQDPFVYGFSMSMGADGQPRVDDFGNLDPSPSDQPNATNVNEARKPLVDVQESHDRVALTAELPGVEKSDINLRAKEREMVVSVDDPENRFFKRIELPAAVRPETTEATYKNGVLDVQVDKAPDSDEGTEVQVE